MSKSYGKPILHGKRFQLTPDGRYSYRVEPQPGQPELTEREQRLVNLVVHHKSTPEMRAAAILALDEGALDLPPPLPSYRRVNNRGAFVRAPDGTWCVKARQDNQPGDVLAVARNGQDDVLVCLGACVHEGYGVTAFAIECRFASEAEADTFIAAKAAERVEAMRAQIRIVRDDEADVAQAG